MLFGLRRTNFLFDPMRRRGLFDESGGGGTNGGGGDGGSGSGTDGGGTGTGGGNAGGGGQQPYAVFPDEATFMARVSRMSKAELGKVATELGFDSIDALKAAAKAHKETQEANKSELEKEKAARAQAEAAAKAAKERADKTLITAEIKVLAIQAGFVDPADAVALVDRSGISVDDKGSITGAKEAIEALKKAKPHLVGKSGQGTVGGGSNPAGGGGGSGAGKNMNDFIRRAAGK